MMLSRIGSSNVIVGLKDVLRDGEEVADVGASDKTRFMISTKRNHSLT